MLNSKSFASPRGTEGYYVATAQWSPDSQFFVFNLTSSGGHSPWFPPIWVFSREQNRFVSFSDMIEGKPTLAAAFSFSGPHTVTATAVDKIGSEKQIPVSVDLAEAIKKIAPTSDP